MRYLVFSDLHFFRGRPYLLDTCKWLAEQIADQRPDRVVFCGDLNHAHNYVETDTLHDMAEAISIVANATMRSTGTSLVALSGNHDTTLRGGGKNIIEALSSLSSNIRAVSSPRDDAEGKALYVPYPPQGESELAEFNAQLAKINTGQRIMFSHLELSDVRYTPASPHTSDHPFTIPGSVRYVVNGHYHHPEQREIAGKEIIIVGSPCYHSYADLLVETPRGCSILDDDGVNLTVTRLANPHGPIYHTIDAIQIAAVAVHPDVARMMLRVKIADKAEYEQWKTAIMRLREVAKAVRVIGKTTEVATEIYKAETSTIDSVDPSAMLKSYVAKKSVTRDVAEYGMRILQGVMK